MAIEELKEIQPSIKRTTDGRTGISLLLGIHKALSNFFVQDRLKLKWLSSSSRVFADYSPKDIMCSGALLGFYDVRAYLDAAN